jgi:hypothetical protein
MTKLILTSRLKWAAEAITRGDLKDSMYNLRLAMSEANRLQRRDLKSLIFRAMNHIRSAQRIGAKS